MIPEEQRITIAKACGWVINDFEGMASSPSGELITWSSETSKMKQLPDYLNDLNACREMEKILTPDQAEIYMDMLANKFDERKIYPNRWRLAHATAIQRCEAFLKTIGKWQAPIFKKDKRMTKEEAKKKVGLTRADFDGMPLIWVRNRNEEFLVTKISESCFFFNGYSYAFNYPCDNNKYQWSTDRKNWKPFWKEYVE